MKRIIISMILTFSLLSTFSYGWFVANWPCILYYGGCPSDSDTSDQNSIQSISPSIGQLSIDAAGFFLQSNSHFQLFLKNIEITPLKESCSIQGANQLQISNESIIYGILKKLIDQSIENMEIARSIYFQVWQTSKNLEPNQVILQNLTQFDYRLISEEKRLISSIFSEVECYLKKGDMPGAFEKIYRDTDEILRGMKFLKSLLEANFIDIPQCWHVNQQILISELFGQYISQVFSNIRKSSI
jgi:hypothetical protein